MLQIAHVVIALVAIIIISNAVAAILGSLNPHLRSPRNGIASDLRTVAPPGRRESLSRGALQEVHEQATELVAGA